VAVVRAQEHRPRTTTTFADLKPICNADAVDRDGSICVDRPSGCLTDWKGLPVRSLRWMSPLLLSALAALLLIPGSAMASTTYNDRVAGIEYAATATVGQFTGAATGSLPGSWDATIVHAPLQTGQTVPITGGTFTLHSRATISGAFTQGAVSPITTPATCGIERFNVTGTMALNGGGSGSFTVVLTHLRAQIGGRCLTYGATVTGRLGLVRPRTLRPDGAP
jgi:hypothetical protein